jgi:uncharacterized membrane protein
MKKLLMLLVLAVVANALPGSADAALKFKNSTPNAVFVAHAFASTSGFGCGYNDGCSGGRGDWKVEGWWRVAPGGTTTVHSQTYGNAWHDFYAEDGLGHVWQGGGGTFCTPIVAFGRCNNDECLGCIGNCPNPNPRILTYRPLRHEWCCGIACGPESHTVNLTL